MEASFREKKDDQYLTQFGATICKRINGLKRTPKNVSDETGMDYDLVCRVVSGNGSIEETQALAKKIGEIYPVDEESLYPINTNMTNGAIIMHTNEAIATNRTLQRTNAMGSIVDYYNYRDSALDTLSPLKPEWIETLQEVEDNDPENPFVIYNKGHFEHQLTVFVGPINFYWQDGNTKKHCLQMNTGDSVYITPYWPHSFSSRDPNQETYIMAVTFGSDADRSIREIGSLNNLIKNFKLDYKNPNVIQNQLINQQLANLMMTPKVFLELISKKYPYIDGEAIINGTDCRVESLFLVADILKIDPRILMPIKYTEGEEIVSRFIEDTDEWLYNINGESLYKIHPFALTPRVSTTRGLNIEVLSNKSGVKDNNPSSLYSFIYNAGSSPVRLDWKFEGKLFSEILESRASAQLLPMVPFSFSNVSLDDSQEKNGRIFLFHASGGINQLVQEEISLFGNFDRLIQETNKWF